MPGRIRKVSNESPGDCVCRGITTQLNPGNMSRQINQKKEAFLASGDPFRSAGFAMPVAGVCQHRTGDVALRSGKLHDGNPRRHVLFQNKTPNFFQYSLSKPTSREGRINRKNRVGVRRLIISAPVITARGKILSPGAASAETCRPIASTGLERPGTEAAPIFTIRSSAAMCADYTCFPAGSRRRASLLCAPTPQLGVGRADFAVRHREASLQFFIPTGRFRAGIRRVLPLLHTPGAGPVFVISTPKSGVVNSGFF